ncbi:MAG: sigma-70 family RNA polymerase sigma factor [Anaerolineae bacterium]|jgi:RNA polymerase sigma-70 factor, ECF subfamily
MYLLEKEKKLVAQAKKGNRRAIATLYDGLFPGIYAYTRMRLPTTADAEDIVSETFLAVVDRLPDFQWQHSGSFRSWVFQIARNHIANFYRRNGHRTTVPLPEAAHALATAPTALEDSFVQKQSLDHLLLKINELSPRRQEVVLLRYFGGLRNNEIAAALELDERTISAHLSRALADLQAELYADQEVTQS